MKRILSFFVLASVLLASSCSLKEDFKGNDSEFATISLTLGGPESSATRAIGDGSSVDLLHYAVYDSEDQLIPALGEVVEVQKFPTQVDITLAKGQTYKIAFWAQNQSTRAYTINNGDVRHVAINYAGYNNNDESRDAFFKTIEHTVTGDIALDVVLERPFAQINLGVTAEDWADAETAGISVKKSMVKISNAAKALDLFNGQVGDGTEVVYALAEIPALSGEILTVEEVAYKYLSMNYILVNSQDATAPAQGLYGEGKELVNAEFTLEMADAQDQPVVVKVDNLPVQRNWRTNVIGRMLTGDISFNISLDPIFDGEENYPDTLEEELLFAAANGGEVTLTQNVEVDYISAEGNFELNIEENVTLTSGSPANYAVIVRDGKTVINSDGEINALGGGIGVINGAEVIYNGGTLEVNTESTSARYNFYAEGQGSTITINDGEFSFSSTLNQKRAYVYAGVGTTVYINGGDFGKASSRDGYTAGIMGDGTIVIKGGSFAFNPSKWVAPGYKAILDGGKYYVLPDTYVTTAAELAAALTSDVAEINVVLYNDIDVAISSLGQQTGGSGEYKLGGENTQKINIDLNGKRLNITTTYWSGIGAKNDNALFTIKNGTMTSSQATGTWNSYDLTFANCNYDIQGVVFEKAIAFTNAGKTASLKNVTINETHDYYAMWVCAEGQTLNIDGLTINSLGRGIKIDEQYVDAPAKVVMNINNAEFKTAKKAAILVKSVAGAEINASNLDITNVAADKVNAVWVDEDAVAYYDLVIVNGCTKVIEGSTLVSNITELQNALNNGDRIIALIDDITGDVTVEQKPDVKITIEGNGHNYDGTILVNGKSARYATAGLTIQNINFKSTSISADAYINLGSGDNSTRYTSNVIVKNCTFEGYANKPVAVKSYTGGDRNVSIIGCTVDNQMHSLAQLTNVETGLQIKDCKVYSKNGANINNSPALEMSNCIFDVTGYAVRVGVNGTVNSEQKTFAITNSSLKSACAESDDAVIVFRDSATNAELNLAGTTLIGKRQIIGNTTKTVITY